MFTAQPMQTVSLCRLVAFWFEVALCQNYKKLQKHMIHHFQDSMKPSIFGIDITTWNE